MTRSDREALALIRGLVERAKSVPMTGNVLVPKSDLLRLLDQADAEAHSVGDGVAAAGQDAGPQPDGQQVTEAEQVLAEARAEAERIVGDARREAADLVRESTIVDESRAEADALRLESHTWVDGHLAEFETGLHRTLEQVEVLRDRLAGRSREA